MKSDEGVVPDDLPGLSKQLTDRREAVTVTINLMAPIAIPELEEDALLPTQHAQLSEVPIVVERKQHA